MPAVFSFATSLRKSGHVVGGDEMPALAKRSLLYQKPTTPTLYGMPYCWPLTCQPAADPPMFLIHDFTYLVRFATFPAFTSSTRRPPPHSWKMSGGFPD